MEGGLADANHRRGRGASRCIKSSVVEAGDDEGVRACGLANLRYEPRNRENLVEIALDAGRPEVGIDGADLDTWGGGGLGRGADLHRHRVGGVRIDDTDAHRFGLNVATEVEMLDTLVLDQIGRGARQRYRARGQGQGETGAEPGGAGSLAG